jgi:uncharacterized membrane protein
VVVFQCKICHLPLMHSPITFQRLFLRCKLAMFCFQGWGITFVFGRLGGCSIILVCVVAFIAVMIYECMVTDFSL